MKLREIEKVYQSLNNIITKELPIKASYPLSKLGKMVLEEFKNYEMARMKIVNKYGDKDEEDNLIQNDNIITISDEYLDDFKKELDELLDIEVNFDFKGISIECFGDISISPIDLLNLGEFIID